MNVEKIIAAIEAANGNPAELNTGDIALDDAIAEFVRRYVAAKDKPAVFGTSTIQKLKIDGEDVEVREIGEGLHEIRDAKSRMVLGQVRCVAVADLPADIQESRWPMRWDSVPVGTHERRCMTTTAAAADVVRRSEAFHRPPR